MKFTSILSPIVLIILVLCSSCEQGQTDLSILREASTQLLVSEAISDIPSARNAMLQNQQAHHYAVRIGKQAGQYFLFSQQKQRRDGNFPFVLDEMEANLKIQFLSASESLISGYSEVYPDVVFNMLNEFEISVPADNSIHMVKIFFQDQLLTSFQLPEEGTEF